MIRSIRSAVLFSDWSIVPHLPSYRKVFGDNIIPAEVIAIIAVIYTLSAVYRYYKWSQHSLPDIDSLDDEKLSLSKWGRTPDGIVFNSGLALCTVQSLLFFMGVDSIESMALFRIIFAFIGVILLWMFLIGSMGHGDSSLQIKVDLAPLLHFVWSIQTFLLPGLYALMEKSVATRKFHLVHIIFWMNFSYTVATFIYLCTGMDEKSTLNQKEKTDDNVSNPPPTNVKQLNIYQLRKRRYSIAISVIVFDTLVSVFMYF